jgi:poly-gamma-glutamate capsule biosynthesis protein CapA/YwtB (metallophosphatase superfamily)
MRRVALVAVLAAASLGAGRVEPVEVFTLTWVGDMAFSSAHGLPSGGVSGALGPVRGPLRADVTVGNLEGTLASTGVSKCGGGVGGSGSDCHAFRAPPSYADGFAAVGFDVLNMANNHANDYGSGALAQTAGALRGAGIAPAGLGASVTRVRAGDARVAFVGFSSYPWSASLIDLAQVRDVVGSAVAPDTLVVALFHGGAEGADRSHVPYGTETACGENRGNLRAFAHAAIDAGAGLVLGSGPHVLRGIERYRKRLIAYSLGNFAGPNTLSSAGLTGLTGVLRLKLTDDGDVLGGRFVSMRMVGGLPRRDPANAAARLVRSLSAADFANRWVLFSDGRLHPPE